MKLTCCIDGDQDKEAEAGRMQVTREALTDALRLGQRAQGKLTPEDAKPVAKVCLSSPPRAKPSERIGPPT